MSSQSSSDKGVKLTKPVRVQRKRTKGWKMPENTIYVGRGSQWGNPYKVGPNLCAHDAVVHFRKRWSDTIASSQLHPRHPFMPFGKPVFLGPLRGKNLACWCPLDQPCHADVLLELANAAHT